MKKMSLFPIVLLGFSCFVFASPISVMVTDTTPGIRVHTKGLFAADLGIWNSPARFDNVKQAIADGGFNFSDSLMDLFLTIIIGMVLVITIAPTCGFPVILLGLLDF